MDFLINLDKFITLYLNSLHSDFFDPIMFFISGKKEWIPFYIVLVGAVFYKRDWKQALLILAGIGVTIALCDRISSGFFKPFFERYRPSQDPEIMNLIHIVNNYRGGKFGFVSSHAANTFGIAVFLLNIFKKRWVSFGLISWALVVSYSRVYLGVHFVGDILCGGILGSLLAFVTYKLYLYSTYKLNLNK